MEKKRIDKLLIGVSLVVVLAVVASLVVAPEASENAANLLFSGITTVFGSVNLLFTFGGILLLMGLCFIR